MTSTTSLFYPVEADLDAMTANLRQLVGARHPILHAAAEHLFSVQGKRVRPAMVLLVSRATMPDGKLTQRHCRLAEITEMIHTASLVHDDVVDESALRRGVATVHSRFTNRVAILAGDFLFAQASWHLANLDDLAVVKLLSEVIMNLAEGEINQGLNRFDTDLTMDAYLLKSYYKTASLMANSIKAAALLSDWSEEAASRLHTYGKYVGLAFQVVDDILDFTASSDVLGKPAGSDLRSGHLTAPVLYAMEEKPQLKPLIEREFAEEGDIEAALDMVRDSSGIERSRKMANEQIDYAIEHLSDLPASEFREVLESSARYVVSRLY
ncbi:MAG: solanesyl diphosphate synthase [Cyanophyceae cyanobacterium]